MTQQIINVGPAPNDGLGDPIRTAFIKTNDNFSQLYSRAQISPPPTLIGSVGDQAGMYAYDSTYFYYCFANYNGSTAVWNRIEQAGNISVAQILNGTSSVAIASTNANATVNINGTSNVVVFSSGGADINGQVSATGNVTGGNVLTGGLISATGNITGNYFIGNGSQLTGLPATYSNSNVALYLPSYNGTLSPSGIYTDGYFYANGLPVSFSGGGGGSYGNTNVAAYLPTYSGNLGGTLTTGTQPNITAVGNLEGLNVNGLNSVEISPVAQNVTIEPTFGGTVTINPAGVGAINNMAIGNGTPQSGSFTTVSALGNITGAFIIGDGSLLTNVSGTGGGSYTDANVAAYLPTYTGNIGGGNINVTGNVNVSGVVNATVDGQLNGLVNGINTTYGAWDFGYIVANTYTNPLQWIFAQTSLGNIDMGSITAPASYAIDIGTIF